MASALFGLCCKCRGLGPLSSDLALASNGTEVRYRQVWRQTWVFACLAEDSDNYRYRTPKPDRLVAQISVIKSGLQFHQHFVISMVVDVLRGMRVTALAEVNLTRFKVEPGDTAFAYDLECPAFDGVEKIVVVMAVRFNALAWLEREFPDTNLVVLKNHLRSDVGHVRSR